MKKSKSETEVQRPPAEILYQDELTKLKNADTLPKPPGGRYRRALFARSCLGEPQLGIRKIRGPPVAGRSRRWSRWRPTAV